MKWENMNYNHLAEDRDRYVNMNVVTKCCIPEMRFFLIISGLKRTGDSAS